MLYERWSFREKQEYLAEWKKVLTEEDDDKLEMILKELSVHAVRCECIAYAEAADALLQHLDLLPTIRKRLLKGSDLSESTFAALLKGEKG